MEIRFISLTGIAKMKRNATQKYYIFISLSSPTSLFLKLRSGFEQGAYTVSGSYSGSAITIDVRTFAKGGLIDALLS